jgi:hypothetical protein
VSIGASPSASTLCFLTSQILSGSGPGEFQGQAKTSCNKSPSQSYYATMSLQEYSPMQGNWINITTRNFPDYYTVPHTYGPVEVSCGEGWKIRVVSSADFDTPDGMGDVEDDTANATCPS